MNKNQNRSHTVFQPFHKKKIKIIHPYELNNERLYDKIRYLNALRLKINKTFTILRKGLLLNSKKIL